MTSQTHPQEVAELVERLRALLAKATPMPWHVQAYYTNTGTPDETTRGMIVNDDDYGIGVIDEEVSHDPDSLSPNLDLIVETVNALPTLLAALTKAPPPVVGDLRVQLIHAASDPGHFAGFRRGRSMGEWIADAVIALQQSRSTPAPVAGNALDAGTALEALKPFAEAADNLDDAHNDRFDIWESGAAMSITAGDLRRAAKAYAATLQSHGQSAGKGVEPLDASREGRE